MNEVDRSLAEQLSVAAHRIDLPPGDLQAVLARGARRRRQHRQRQFTSLALVAAVVAGLAAVQLRTEDRPKDVSVFSTSSPLRLGDTGISWRHTDTSDALAYVSSQTAGGAVYAISTAPGPADPSSREGPPRVLYRSDDGVAWEPVATIGEKDLYLTDLSARGSRLYAVGTGPASATTTSGRSASPLLVRWSDDQASSWQSKALPLDMEQLAANMIDLSMGSPKIAAGDGGILVITAVSGRLDLTKRLPPGVQAANGWAVSEVGIDVLGSGPGCPSGSSPQPAGRGPATTVRVPSAGMESPVQPLACFPAGSMTPDTIPPQEAYGVVRSFTWKDLGISGDLLRAVQGLPMAFWSADGDSFERVDPPLERTSMLELASDGSGFTLAAQQVTGRSPKVTVLNLDESRTWKAVGTPARSSWTTSLGQLAGRIAMISDMETEPAISVLEPSGWTTASLRGAVDPKSADKTTITLATSAIGPLGVAAVIGVIPDPIARAGGIHVSAGGYTLHVHNTQWAATVTDRDGKEVARTDSLHAPADDSGIRFERGNETIRLVDGNGEEIVSFDSGKLEVPERELGNTRSEVSWRIAFSRDGVTWSSEPLDKLVPGPIANVTNVMVTSDRVLVTVAHPSGDRAPGPSTVLIGTL